MNRAHGIDISHWQGRFGKKDNPPRPIDFVIQKLTEGLYLDPSYETLKADIQSIPIRGAYHYWRPRWNWRDQMDKFLTALTPDYHFWALDVEKAMNYDGAQILNRPVAGFAEFLPLALEYLVKNDSRPGVIYTGPGVWMDWLKPIWGELKKYELWVAHYWNSPNPEGIPNYYTIRGCDTMRRDWRFWQYDCKGWNNRGKEFGVQSFGLDLNVYNGSVDDLLAWAIPEQAPVKYCPTCGQEWKV